MSLNQVAAGVDVPNDVNVVIEIPANSGSVKYEVDKLTGTLMVDRFLSTSMHYPCNYGYIPQTLCEDGDPVDMLVVTPSPLLAGIVVRCRPIGMLNMIDEAGRDSKLLSVPISKLCPMYDGIHEATDLPEQLLAEIVHFFTHYKDLEPNKWVETKGWSDKAHARQEIRRCIELYQGVS